MSIEELKQNLDITKMLYNSNHILLQHGYTLEQINNMTHSEMYKLMDQFKEEMKNE